MRIAGLALVLLAIAVTTGCGARKSSAPEVFRPFGPAAVEAAALKSGTCLAARTDGDPARSQWSRTRCARHMPALAYLMVDFHRCPVQYNARRGDLGVVVCQDAVAATTRRRAMRAWKGETDAAIGRTSIRVRNVIVYGGSAARMHALARELR